MNSKVFLMGIVQMRPRLRRLPRRVRASVHRRVEVALQLDRHHGPTLAGKKNKKERTDAVETVANKVGPSTEIVRHCRRRTPWTTSCSETRLSSTTTATSAAKRRSSHPRRSRWDQHQSLQSFSKKKTDPDFIPNDFQLFVLRKWMPAAIHSPKKLGKLI